jgi:hypothetical protein
MHCCCITASLEAVSAHRLYQAPSAHLCGGGGGVLRLQLGDELVDLSTHFAASCQPTLRAKQGVQQGGLV